jgi:PGAP1-like protein
MSKNSLLLRGTFGGIGVAAVLLLCASGASASPSCPFPVVLQPGIYGYRELPIVGHHFNTTPTELRALGCVVVDTAPMLVASVTERALALGVVVDQALIEHHADKVVIIGHSQGGLDALTMVQLRPDLQDRIAAVATLSTPFRGTPLANWAEIAPPLVFPITSGMAMMVDALQVVTPTGTREMKPAEAFGSLHRHPAVRGRVTVPLFSVSGVTGTDDDHACGGGVWSAPMTTDLASPLQFVGGMMLRTSGIGSHDGVVPVNSSKAEGRFLGCVPADHLDWGVGAGNSAQFSAASFMTAMALALQDVGLHGAAGINAHLPHLADLAKARMSNTTMSVATTTTTTTPANPS